MRTNKSIQEKKSLQELNLLDRFLFAEASEKPEIMIPILEIILGKEIVLKHLPQAEKEIRSAVWSKIVKMDVLSVDSEDVLYEMEVQKKNTGNLPRRSRAYNGYIDSKILPPGDADYNSLNDVYIIIVTPFDVFGEGRYMYTFRMMSEEVGIRFMNAWEEKILDRQEAYEEGFGEGECAAIISLMKNKNWTCEEAMDALGVAEEKRIEYAKKVAAAL